MTPDEIKARLDQSDEMLKEKLAELGFTPEEIHRQLDRSVPDSVKAAERETALKRKFQQDLADPKSGLMDAILARAVDDVEKRMPEIKAEVEAKRRERRMKLVAGGVAAVGLAAVGIWYFVLRDKRTWCEKKIGPLAEIEKLTGTKVKAGHGFEVSDDTCSKYVDEQGQVGRYIVMLDTTRRSSFPYKLKEYERGKYTDIVRFDTPAGPAVLFVAGDAKEVSTAELAADVERRAAVRRPGDDPMGAALANLPPAQHSVLFTTGNRTVELQLDRKVWTVEAAKTYASAVAARAK